MRRASCTFTFALAALAAWPLGAAAAPERLQLAVGGDFTPPPDEVVNPPSPPPPPPPAPAADPCEAAVTEKDGIVTLELTDAARGGQQIVVTVDEIAYGVRFEASGHLRLEAPIFHKAADVQWRGRAGAACSRRGVVFSNFQAAYLAALIWDGPYDLALHVVEPPDGGLGGPTGYVFPGRPNINLRTGLGFLRSFGTPVANTSRIWLYTLPADRNPASKLPLERVKRWEFQFFIEFVSRGNPARRPYCGGGALSEASFRIWHLQAGVLEQKRDGFKSDTCDKTWTPDDYYAKWKWQLGQVAGRLWAKLSVRVRGNS